MHIMNQLDLMPHYHWRPTQQPLLPSDDKTGDWWLFYFTRWKRGMLGSVNNHPRMSVLVFVFVCWHDCMMTTFYCAITTQCRWFWGDFDWGFVCRCCCHGNSGWNALSESWVLTPPWDQVLTSSGPCENIASEGAGEMRFCPAPATCSFFTNCNLHLLPARSVTPVSSSLPLKIREQLSLDYLILRQSPRIPWTELS